MEQTKAQKVLRTVLIKAWRDEGFKQKLIINPIEAIEEATGEKITLPAEKNIEVQDQTNDSIIYLNIPPKANMDDMELNEEQLETIAGGNDPIIVDPTTSLAEFL